MTANTQKTPNVFVRFYRFAKLNGWRCTIYQTLNRIANFRLWHRWFQISIVNIYSAPIAELKQSDKLPNLYEVRPAETNDLNELKELGEYCGDADRMKSRIKRGDMCMLNLCKGKIGAMMWYSIGPNEYKDDWAAVRCNVRFPNQSAWMYDGKGTRLGAWGGMMMNSARHLKAMGIEEIYTMVDWENRKSIDPMRSLGLTQAGSFMFLKLFGIKFTRCKPQGQRRWRRLPARIGQLELSSNGEYAS